MLLLKGQKYIEAFEMWYYRTLPRISWTEHERNEWVLEQLQAKKELLWGG